MTEETALVKKMLFEFVSRMTKWLIGPASLLIFLHSWAVKDFSVLRALWEATRIGLTFVVLTAIVGLVTCWIQVTTDSKKN